MRQNLAGWEGGIGRWWELLRATLPRSRITSLGRRIWSYSPPSRFNSRRAAATRTSLSQSLKSPEPLRLRANEGGEEGRRYAPPRLIGQEKIMISGTPDEERICTSHVERGNWTLRTHLRRFTRLSNGFSRKKQNLRAALALYFAYYNFVRMYKTIRMTPAMAAGIARKPWNVGDLSYGGNGSLIVWDSRSLAMRRSATFLSSKSLAPAPFTAPRFTADSSTCVIGYTSAIRR